MLRRFRRFSRFRGWFPPFLVFCSAGCGSPLKVWGCFGVEVALATALFSWLGSFLLVFGIACCGCRVQIGVP